MPRSLLFGLSLGIAGCGGDSTTQVGDASGDAGGASTGDSTRGGSTTAGSTTEGSTTAGSTSTAAADESTGAGSGISGGTTTSGVETSTTQGEETTAASSGTTGGEPPPSCEPTPPPFELDPAALACDVWLQDCPEGQNCIAWASGAHGMQYDATHCVDVVDAPGQPGAPCTPDPDSCELGSVCDPGPFGWVCAPMCQGSPDDPSCPAGTGCAIDAVGVLSWCLPTCDPLVADSCAIGSSCFAFGDTFTCFTGFPEPQPYLAPCTYANECDQGLACVPGKWVPGCLGASCCAALCDLDAPQCPSPELGEVCSPWSAEGGTPPELEHVGRCVLACEP